MPICNVIDHRSGPNRFNTIVTAIFEPSHHDNSAPGATQHRDVPPTHPEDFTYFHIHKTTVGLAIKFANQKWRSLPVTLYLYDLGSHPMDIADACYLRRDRTGRLVLTRQI
jgi:hypothetical protein